jgi:hypothetical protein
METSTWYVIKQRLAWIRIHERGVPVTQVCLHYGISRKTFYKWLRGMRKEGGTSMSLRIAQGVPTAISSFSTQSRLSYCSQSHRGAAPGPAAHHPLWPPAFSLLSVSGGLPYQRLRCLPRAATGGPGEETPFPTSEEAPKLRHASPRPAGTGGCEVSAPLAPKGSSRTFSAIPLLCYRRLHPPPSCLGQL